MLYTFSAPVLQRFNAGVTKHCGTQPWGMVVWFLRTTSATVNVIRIRY